MRSLRARAHTAALRRPLVAGVVLAPLVAAILVACGGGGMGSTSSGGNSPQSVSSGTVTGLGSVFVNGIEYDVSTAAVTDALGHAQPSSALKMGMQVQLTGRDPTTVGGMGSAATVVFSSDLVGAVESVDAATGTIMVLGQEVDANADTVWDPALGGFAGLTPGEVLQVFSLYDSATGRYVASRIEPDADATAYRLRGMVTNLDTAAKTYTVGTTMIDYSGATAAPAGLADGLVVTAELQTTMGSSAWMATDLQMRNQGMPSDHSTVHVRGLVSAADSPMSFTLDGWHVDASGATFPAGQGAIVDGASVQVDGITSHGAVVATTVDIQQPGSHGGNDFQVHGPIDGIHANVQTFVLRGTTVSYSGDVAFSGGTAADLAVGTKVLVKGQLAADGNTVQAVSISIGQ